MPALCTCSSTCSWTGKYLFTVSLLANYEVITYVRCMWSCRPHTWSKHQFGQSAPSCRCGSLSQLTLLLSRSSSTKLWKPSDWEFHPVVFNESTWSLFISTTVLRHCRLVSGKARVTPNTDVLWTARMAPNHPGSNLCRSGVVRGRPGWVFLLRQSKFVEDSSSSWQRYELLRHRHGIITDGSGATTK